MMLAKCPSTKPLYKLQRNLDYIKHKQKLKQITSKSPSGRTDKSLQVRPWVKQKLKNQLQKSGKMIEQQNEKLLSKLMKISTRNSLHIADGIKHRDNPHRKNWLKSIKRENQEFGEKLIHLRSSLEYSRFTKSIDDYEKVKKSMKINRRPRLPQLTLNHNGSDYIKKMLNKEIESSLDKRYSDRKDVADNQIKLIKTQPDLGAEKQIENQECQ